MDPEKVAYFEQKFSAYDSNEFDELITRRNSLADEAIEAVDRILATRGQVPSASHAKAPLQQMPAPSTPVPSIKEQTQAAKDLWGGQLSKANHWMSAVAVGAPIQNLVKSFNIGAIWVGLLVVVGFYVGFKIGKAITKTICANADVPLVS
jgi:hypothetical protein